ncbi:MAG: nitrogen fixation protein NifZ [Bradyrhizobium sp.]|nr:nitrogen fixation protein NifZ [Bradyrhizobium sp.]
MARVVYDPRLRPAAHDQDWRRVYEFSAGEPIRSVALIRNDGMYPHKDIGEALVLPGDIGVVRQSWRFLGHVYYTVEFMARAVFVIMRGGELARIGTSFDPA